jgi:hypothetical protein
VNRENNMGEAATHGRTREELSAERVEASVQERQWRTVLRTLLSTLPTFASQLRVIAQDGERMATQVSSQFLHIAEKIETSCEPRAEHDTASRANGETSTTASDAVVLEINRIVMALQFQDTASQRLENLAKLMDEIESVVSRWAAASPEHRQEIGDVVSPAWVERIREVRPDVRYPEAASGALPGPLTSTPAANGHDGPGKVELF